MGFKKLGEKINKHIPVIIISVLTVIFTLVFYKFSLEDNVMVTYYSTFTRVFSLLFGVTLGFVHTYYKEFIPKVIKEKKLEKIIFYFYILITIALSIFIEAKSVLFPYAMILVTIITCRLIEYGIITQQKDL